MENILVPIDGSEKSLEALRIAITLARKLNGEILLLNAQLNIENLPNVKRFLSLTQIREYQDELAEESLREAKCIVNESNVSYRTKVVMGVPSTVICREAEINKSSFIVMGSRGLGAIKGAFLGSVSYKVLHEAPCPVTIVP